jgi:hypothetical protein
MSLPGALSSKIRHIVANIVVVIKIRIVYSNCVYILAIFLSPKYGFNYPFINN